MSITEHEVEHIAELSRLQLDGEQLAVMGKELNAILSHISRIQSVNLSAVGETTRMGEEVNKWRTDVRGTSLDVEVALANAPERDGHYFKVESIHE